MLIDCDTCAVRGDGCADCVMTALLGPIPEHRLADEAVSALAVLADAGMLPPLRLIPGGAVGSEAPQRPVSGSETNRRAGPPMAAGG